MAGEEIENDVRDDFGDRADLESSVNTDVNIRAFSAPCTFFGAKGCNIVLVVFGADALGLLCLFFTLMFAMAWLLPIMNW